uniref:Zinc finger CCCH domain-containing protein 14 n=1 Tax=Culex tarsalis TaxID=7177 RepID=A0A1Q3EZS6_CULTA
MDSLGSEIGQKMRSAVKAKLIELGTGSASGYIDDELPDYVMIMVANKRSRQQMIDDLTLFLAGQTEVFVNWLHQVLQKLEEVTLPAGSQVATAAAATTTTTATVGAKEAGKVVKEAGGKRKNAEQRKDKKKDKKTKRKEKSPEGGEHTPPHPTGQLGGVGSIQEVFANQYIQQAKKTLEITDSAPKKDPGQLTPPLRESSPRRNDFDIPTISEIAGQSALQKHQKELSELEEIQQKIKQAKKQLKEMGSESEDEDFLNIKANDEDLENIEDGGAGAAARRKEKRKALEQEKARKQAEAPAEEERSMTPPAPAPAQKKKSILERLGSRPDPKPTPQAAAPEPEQQPPAPVANKSNIISLSAHRREERELYIPVFRRKEMEEQQQQHQQRAKSRETNRSRPNRSRSRERDRRRRESSRDRSRNRREREREREKERERRRDRSRGKGISNGAAEVRTRIGSRVIVLPPKPEYVEEDELEVPIPSVIKIQPRPQVPKNKQPSKNLLLKAMAEAQRSTASNLKKTISNNRSEESGSSSSRPKRMLIEIPGNNPDGTPPTVDVHYAEEDEDDDDIVKQVLLRDDDVDDELQQILDANDEYIPEPVTISISGRSDTDSDGYVYVPAGKKASSEEQTVPEQTEEYDPKDPAKNPKFVVTLDGAYKKSSRTSPSHTPPPPASSSTSKPSIKDRIGKKVSSSSDKSPPREDDRDHIETLKRRKERFSVKASAAAAAAAKRSTSLSPEKRSSKSSSKRSPNKKRSSNSTSNNNSSSKPSSTSGTRNRASPADLNELLLQRTKELLVDDSVSSSPIYMSKSDYEKIEPNSSSRKRKRVSPIQFELTDDEADDDSDGEYNHHRDREHRERKQPPEPRISMDEEGGGGGERRRDHQRESERRSDEGERRKGGNNGSGPYSEVKVSPTKKIKKLESSRKFDDVPQLLSSVSVPAEGLLASKSKGLIKERCKYFPSCRQGDSCEFLHPSTPCKAFPACKFGDNCLYLHPYCKYDKTCHRLDCNFMHSKPLLVGSSAGPSAPPLASSVVPVQNYKTITAKPLPALCKFYPGCTNGLCPYYHPKMCRFGRNCMNKVECNFYHHDLPGGVGGGGIGGGAEFHEVHSKDKFKWISPFSA